MIGKLGSIQSLETRLGSSVNDSTCFLVAGASYSCPEEVLHSNNTTLVLPTSLTPQHSHEHLARSVDITAQPRERLMPHLMRLGTRLLMLMFELRLEPGDGDLPLGLLRTT